MTIKERIENAKIPVMEFQDFRAFIMKSIEQFVENHNKSILSEMLVSKEYSQELSFDNLKDFCKVWWLHIHIPLTVVYDKNNQIDKNLVYLVQGANAMIINMAEI